ncbi:hypothetical protein [Tumidithrix helvetica]|uniref:hypothetical protein n=1 Tax=Tumidithrix helvetica TaxID=3457545 RepID=UPI003CC53588
MFLLHARGRDQLETYDRHDPLQGSRYNLLLARGRDQLETATGFPIPSLLPLSPTR